MSGSPYTFLPLSGSENPNTTWLAPRCWLQYVPFFTFFFPPNLLTCLSFVVLHYTWFWFTYWAVPPFEPSRQSHYANKQHVTKKCLTCWRPLEFCSWLFHQKGRCVPLQRRSCWFCPSFFLCLLIESLQMLFQELIPTSLFVRQVNVRAGFQRG